MSQNGNGDLDGNNLKINDMIWNTTIHLQTRTTIGFPAHFRHLFVQFHQFPIQFRPEKLTAFKSKVQFRQIVIHIRFFANQI